MWLQVESQGSFPLCYRFRLQLRRRPQRSDARLVIPLALRWFSTARLKAFNLSHLPFPVLPINSHREACRQAETKQ